MKKILIATILMLAILVAHSQENVEAYLQANGLALGLNEGRYVAVGSADLKANPSESSFDLARSLAFKQAFLEAKVNIKRFLGFDLSNLIRDSLSGKKSREEILMSLRKNQIDLALFDKISATLQEKLEKENPKNKAHSDIVLTHILKSESFEKLISDSVNGLVGSSIVLKVFEEESKITVIASYSASTSALAGILNKDNSDYGIIKLEGMSVEDMVKNMKLSELYSSRGVSITNDKDGNLVILSFGQDQARTSTKNAMAMASSKAEMQALASINNFVKSMITQSDSSIKETSRNKIHGIERLRDWSFVDPKSNSTICGVVLVLNTKNLKK